MLTGRGKSCLSFSSYYGESTRQRWNRLQLVVLEHWNKRSEIKLWWAWLGFMPSSHMARTYGWLWAIRKILRKIHKNILYTPCPQTAPHTSTPNPGISIKAGRCQWDFKSRTATIMVQKQFLISAGIAKASGLNCMQLMSMKVLCILPFHHTVHGAWLVYPGSGNLDSVKNPFNTEILSLLWN